MVLPKLKRIGGDLNCAGNKEMNENSFPALEFVGGDIILSGSGFTSLPPNLKEVRGNGILSKSDSASLLYSMISAAEKGIIKGRILFSD